MLNVNLLIHSENKRPTVFAKQKTLSYTYVIVSSDEWLFLTGPTAALVEASDGADDEDGVCEKTLSGNSKTGENTPLLDPLTLGVGGRERSPSPFTASKAKGLSCL